MRSVTATATRSGGWWAVEIPEVPGAFTQARRLDQVPAMAADAVAMLTGEKVTVNVVPVLPDPQQQQVDHVRQASKDAAERLERSAAETRALVTHLRDDGLSVRDVGELLGVSPQRISQLAPATRRLPAAAEDPR